ncbi:PD-(D/E)XK nuclease-like domain-containing protein [Kitasatospora viridis]|nr:PD-(D/E)XK nuclease-like domain-containing protein [Kitasatospora viridis]
MTNEQYHADPVPGGSLSSSGARKLLAPSCPALFRHEQLHGQKPRKVFDLGAAAHGLVLGAGPELARIDADEWRTAAVKAKVAAARERGAIPLRPAEYEQVQQMAAALRQHPIASALFAPGSGLPEQSLFWTDQATGVWRRARLDWLPTPSSGRRLIIPDYKTCASADPEAIAKSVLTYGYHQQDPWYVDAVRALGLGDESTTFVFVFQEKSAPYLVNVVQLDAVSRRLGRKLNRKAISLYRDCVTADRWPGYSDGIEIVSLPAWAQKQLQEIQ